MRKSTSRVVRLPGEVREEINRKMDAGWEYRAIRKWLFEQVAECDVPALGLVKGDSFSLAWLRSAKSTEHAWHHCELALGNWFRGQHQVWLREQARGGEAMRVVRRAKVLTREIHEVHEGDTKDAKGSGGNAATEHDGDTDTAHRAVATPDEVSIEGGDILMRSVLIDAISSVEESKKDPKEIAQLANAWARLNQGRMEEEKLKLKTETKLQMAFKELSTELRNDPEALELFNKLHAVVKRLEEKEAGKMARN